MQMLSFPPNDIGLTKYTGYSDFSSNGTLEDQLDKAGVKYIEALIPHLVGMAGEARLLFYTSPKTGSHVTVLVVPLRGDIDSFGEDYYYFEGVSMEDALRDESRWLNAYDVGRAMVKEAIREQIRAKQPRGSYDG
jgi:hypothetical protein